MIAGDGGADQPDQLHDALCDRARFVGAADGEEDDELVAAEPRDEIRFPQALAEPIRGRDEDLIADPMPMTVVDLFEVIDVQGQDRSGRAVRLQWAMRLARLESGQIVVGHVGEPVLELATFGGVDELREREDLRVGAGV